MTPIRPQIQAFTKFAGTYHDLRTIRHPLALSLLNEIYIDITAALRAVFYIARVLACNIKYLHEGASPRRRYFRIARRAQRARVLYDNTALKCEDDIVYIHQRAFHQVDMEHI